MIKQLNNLFSTPFWTFDFHKDNPQLAKTVQMDGLTFSKYVTDKKAKNETPTNVRYDFFNHIGYGISGLRENTTNAIIEVAKDQRWTNYTVDIRARQNVIFPGQCDTPHHHQGLDLIGVYYVTVPENSGDILLFETRGSVNRLWEDPMVTPDSMGRTGRVYYRHKPQVGTLIMFPSYLFHAVETNLSNENRISIVMDIRINKEYDDVYV
jgi:uncharacterized protein (TIGR02466 family)